MLLFGSNIQKVINNHFLKELEGLLSKTSNKRFRTATNKEFTS